MGVTVRQDPKDQCWYVHVTHQNRRKARKIGPGREGERNAQKVADVARGQIALDTFDWWAKVPAPTSKAEPTLAAYVARWLRSPSVTQLKVGTQEKYEETMRIHWLPDLGTVPLSRLTREQIKDGLQQKRGYSKSLLMMAVSVLGACLNAAVEDQLIVANPGARLGKLVGGIGKKAIRVFEPQDLAHLLTACSLKFPHIYPATMILARTGMRLGEALTLQAGDIDLAHHRVWVRRTWGSRKAKVGERRINTPKNGKERGVDLSDQLADVLKEHLRHSKPRSNGWLFPSSQTKMPWLPDTFRSQWALLLKEARLPYRNPHVLRHTYASILLQNGESLEYVMRQLGHSSIKITVDTYGHLVPSMNRRAVNRLDEICK